jgi:hypothetical protein
MDAIVDYLTKARLSVALSRHFALSQDKLYLYDKVIGDVRYDGTCVYVTLTDKMFEQEFRDLIRRNHFERVIEIGYR